MPEKLICNNCKTKFPMGYKLKSFDICPVCGEGHISINNDLIAELCSKRLCDEKGVIFKRKTKRLWVDNITENQFNKALKFVEAYKPNDIVMFELDLSSKDKFMISAPASIYLGINGNYFLEYAACFVTKHKFIKYVNKAPKNIKEPFLNGLKEKLLNKKTYIEKAKEEEALLQSLIKEMEEE